MHGFTLWVGVGGGGGGGVISGDIKRICLESKVRLQ